MLTKIKFSTAILSILLISSLIYVIGNSMAGPPPAEAASNPDPADAPAAFPEPARVDGAASITIQANGTATALNACVLGTNLPAWLGASTFEDNTFQARTMASGVSLIRMPGGSWSNWYPWKDCETNTGDCDDWIADPTDFINFLKDTGLAGMWTVNQNRTAKEAAALVAFMNGSVSDNTVIGVDVKGVDWGTVGQWAQLRASHGNPNPIGIKFWEIGNEIYGGESGMGKDCQPWGWEPVWTCDGTEYVNGIGSGSNRKEGYLEFRNAMQAVDPTILVGAVGIYPQSDYANWGNEVINAAGSVMDFYILHQYAFFDVPSNMQAALSEPYGTWDEIRSDVDTSFDQNAGGRDVPYAVTEHNLFSVQDLDNGQWMTRAVNALFMADTLGQMMKNGFDLANQWDLANGQAWNGTDYGLMNADTFSRYPQYYVYPLWARFGSEMLPVTNSENASTTLSVYAGRVDADTLSLMVINKTGGAISANIAVNGVGGITGGYVDVMQATSLNATSVTFNGVSNPANDLSNAPPSALSDLTLPIEQSFPAYSITLIRMDVNPTTMAGNAPFIFTGGNGSFLPFVSNGRPATPTPGSTATPNPTITPTPGPTTTPPPGQVLECK